MDYNEEQRLDVIYQDSKHVSLIIFLQRTPISLQHRSSGQ